MSMNSNELLPLGKEVQANLTVEELESRLEMTFLHMTAVRCNGGGCLAQCCEGGGSCLGKQSTSVDDLE